MMPAYDKRTVSRVSRNAVDYGTIHLRRLVGASLLILCLFPFATEAAIARDSTASIGASGGSITTVAADTVVFVTVNCGATPACAVTVGGTSATFIGESESSVGGQALQDFWVHMSSSGSKTVTTNSGGGLAAIAYTGVDSTNPVVQHTGNINVSSLTLTGVLTNSWVLASWNRSGANVNLSSGPIVLQAGSAGGVGLGDSNGAVSGSQTENWDSSSLTMLWMIEIQPTVSAAVQRSVLSLITAYWIY